MQKWSPILRKYFEDGEISNYWNNIKREIPRHGGPIMQQWRDISKLPQRTGQQLAKRQVLSLRISKPDVWTQHAVSQIHPHRPQGYISD